jgi:hypothetical protein
VRPVAATYAAVFGALRDAAGQPDLPPAERQLLAAQLRLVRQLLQAARPPVAVDTSLHRTMVAAFARAGCAAVVPELALDMGAAQVGGPRRAACCARLHALPVDGSWGRASFACVAEEVRTVPQRLWRCVPAPRPCSCALAR